MLKPLLDRVIVKIIQPEETTKSGIILTSTSKEKPQIAEVQEVGPGGIVDGNEVKMYINKGNKVVLSQYAGTEISIKSYIEKGLEAERNSRVGAGFLVIDISDKGGGVPEEELEMITEKFKRGSNSEGKDGSGLGLYISKYMMEKMRLVTQNRSFPNRQHKKVKLVTSFNYSYLSIISKMPVQRNASFFNASPTSLFQ